jgi:hypothetical protein
LAEELRTGTIDAILRMSDGELGAAVLEGRMKLPDDPPVSETMRIQEQRAIAGVLDARVEELGNTAEDPVDLLSHMADQMPLFKRLVDISGDHGLSDLCNEYPGLYRFTKTLELLAAGIQSGDTKVPW